MRFAYEFYRRRGDFTGGRYGYVVHVISRETDIVGEAAVMRFVCDERDRGCGEGREGGEGRGDRGKKRETRSSFKLASAESRQRGSAVEEI